jgi:glyoxylase-like metal-dependent hydrolase (beta-lactamase superfamily II)
VKRVEHGPNLIELTRFAPVFPIRRIVLTHAHFDHVGSLDALARALPGVEVLISARDVRLPLAAAERKLAGA